MGSHHGRLGDLLVDRLPAVAVSFADDLPDVEVENWIASGLDVAELRIDWFSSFDPDHVVTQARRFDRFATIATIRSRAEGGEWSGSEEERLSLFCDLLPHVDAVDIELSSDSILERAIGEAHRGGVTVIVSHHDFSDTPAPDELQRIDERARAAGADLVKVAVRGNSLQDIRVLAEFTLRRSDWGVIVLAMGPWGPLSRVLLPALGSRLTFARGDFHAGSIAAQRAVPGQIGFDEHRALLEALYPSFPEETDPGEAPDKAVS